MSTEREQWERLAEGQTFDGMESWLPWLVADGRDSDDPEVLVDLLGKVVQTYPDTPSGEQASMTLATIQADSALWQTIQDRQAAIIIEGMLGKAELYFNARMYDKASVFYKDVIKSYPGTDSAAKAQARLDEIQRLMRVR